MTYYVAETDANGFVNNNDHWEPTSAKTLPAAKRAATRKQVFQGTSLHIGIKTPDGFEPVAVKRADPIDMNRKGVWEELQLPI